MSNTHALRLSEFVNAVADLEESLKQDLARDGSISNETISLLVKQQKAHKAVATMLELISEQAQDIN